MSIWISDVVPSVLLHHLLYPFPSLKKNHRNIRNYQNTLPLFIYMYTFMLFGEHSLNIHFDFQSDTLTHTHTHSYTACSLSRTISLWISGPPCCSSCVTWQYTPLSRKHKTQDRRSSSVYACVKKKGERQRVHCTV